ncbi:protein NEN1 isoform X2 [Sorghum bicolor]|uniref:Exonuclease domain-containing protein n=1 Tax=Sorghum bicolor TaxID=4558 RepID=A0A1Z5S8E0_SORBI|nr:protein NEN1 isoform X2 [Sorghum bicolor]OQU92190.1 hypothetical protein SORBI_3001G307200 [Sorghum bicolor]|eukprot:XP_021311701.1 protein NEN1 isoform X2 [Sorghum bicolor]
MAAAPASSSAASAADSREEIVFLDVETSTPPRVLLEFGAVVVCSRRLVDVSSYATLVRPADPDAAVPDPTARCSGITRDAVADAPPFRDVADKVYDVLHGRVWAGHNIVKFDSVIIRDAFAEIGRPPPEPKGMVDTLPLLTQWFGPRAGDMKLASLANYFGLGKQRHRSLDDVKMNIDVLKNCATVLFLEESLRGVLPVQNMLEGATIRTQGTSDPATNRDSNELVGSHVEEMVLDTTTQMDARSSIGFSGFVEHKGAQLHLSCADLEVRWVSSKVLRPQLSIRVDIPDNLSKVLVFCDNLAQSSSPEGRSSSPWKPLIKRYGNANRPTVRLNIPTVVSGNTAMYSTQIYQKDCNGVIPKLASRKIDAANLESMLQGKKVDAFFSLEIYGYQQNAGIRLVAKRLDVHF